MIATGKVIIEDNMNSFVASAHGVMDDAVREGARDILVAAKTKAPLDKGGLRSDTAIKRIGAIIYRVSFFKEYARYQEFGGDANRTVRRYTTPGTGKHYLKSSGDAVADRLRSIFRKHGGRARA